jgi:tRNA (cmo5U34)-methyltransferase
VIGAYFCSIHAIEKRRVKPSTTPIWRDSRSRPPRRHGQVGYIDDLDEAAVNTTSISAYDLPDRVARYDADMDLMHPNRAKMIQVALEVLPFATDRPLRALDLGVGTGFFTERFLRLFPAATVVAIDGAAAMLDLARARLGPLAARVRFEAGDFRDLARLVSASDPFDVCFSSYALHHLSRADKQEVVMEVRRRLAPGGWFLNADLVVADSPDVEARIQALRVDGIVRRARGLDPRFPDAAATRAWLDRMEAAEGDQPIALQRDLDVLRAAGLHSVGVFWLEHREAVSGGTR